MNLNGTEIQPLWYHALSAREALDHSSSTNAELCPLCMALESGCHIQGKVTFSLSQSKRQSVASYLVDQRTLWKGLDQSIVQ